jgi:hypothetical protein
VVLDERRRFVGGTVVVDDDAGAEALDREGRFGRQRAKVVEARRGEHVEGCEVGEAAVKDREVDGDARQGEAVDLGPLARVDLRLRADGVDAHRDLEEVGECGVEAASVGMDVVGDVADGDSDRVAGRGGPAGEQQPAEPGPLGADDGAGGEVAQREAAVPDDAVLVELDAVDLLTLHRLDGMTPQLGDGAEPGAGGGVRLR